MKLVGFPANSFPRTRFPATSISFQGSRPKKIQPHEVTLRFETTNVSPAEQQVIQEKLPLFLPQAGLARTKALKNKFLNLSPFSKRQFASLVELTNGITAIGTNFEVSQEEQVCGERAAVTMALQKAVDKLPYTQLQKMSESERSAFLEGLKVKRLIMASSKPFEAEIETGRPCGDCISWMAANTLFTPQTQSMVLYQNPESTAGPKYTFRVRTVQDFWPGFKTASIGSSSISKLPMTFSPEAKISLATMGISPSKVSRVIQQAMATLQSHYLKAKITEKTVNLATALFTVSQPGRSATALKTISAQQIQWASRWPQEADLQAVAQGLQSLNNATVKGLVVCYYGDNPMPASPKSIAKIAQKLGGANLIAVIEDGALTVTTLQNRMPYLHSSVKA